MNEKQLMYLQEMIKGNFTQKETIKVEVKEKVGGAVYFYEVRPQGDGKLPYRLLDEKGEVVQLWDVWESEDEIKEAFRRNSF